MKNPTMLVLVLDKMKQICVQHINIHVFMNIL